MKFAQFIWFILFLCNSLMNAQDINESELPLKQIGDNLYQIENILIDSDKREITIPGKINMQKGLIELLACTPGGKVHESVLTLDVVPYYMQVSLLLLGLNSSEAKMYEGIEKDVKGDKVEIWVKWSLNGEEKTVRGEEMLWDVVDKKPMEKTHWVFVGSKIVNGKFKADDIGSLITTYNDPFTILDNPLDTGTNDEVYWVNEQIVPPKGTLVNVILKPI